MRRPARAATRIRLIHARPDEARKRVVALHAAGYNVDYSKSGPRLLTELRANPPQVAIIDLTRVPSQGRDLGVYLRKHRSTRQVSLVFAGGEGEKLARVKALLPDAIYTDWRRIRSALRKALQEKKSAPIVPSSVMAAYEGAPLPQKLGLREGCLVALIGAPRGFEGTVSPLPPGAQFARRPRSSPDLTIWFAKTRRILEARLPRIAEASRGELWIAWPKQSSDVATDLNQTIVRKAGLAIDLVDYKVCAIDETWSALRFTRRRLVRKR